SSATVSIDDYFDDLPPPPLENTVIAVTGYMLYSIAIFIGIPLNVYVLTRMFTLARKCSDVYSNGVGVCLFIMAVSDLISLSTITIHILLSIQSSQTLATIGEPVLNYVCKIVIYSMHVSTSLSIWSWLLMSVLRYLSVYHPLVYIRLWQLPTKALATSFVVAATANSWLLLSVTNNDHTNNGGGCTQVALFE
ncbi:hypothetical protein PFISCL1PPCAC_7885, partial [Pristionchus fissidentatus]